MRVCFLVVLGCKKKGWGGAIFDADSMSLHVLGKLHDSAPAALTHWCGFQKGREEVRKGDLKPPHQCMNQILKDLKMLKHIMLIIVGVDGIDGGE